MASADGVTLLSNATTTGSYVQYHGGRASLFIHGTLATTTKLQMLGMDSSTAVDVATISAVGLTTYDLPAGRYRISLSGGSPAAIYAGIFTIPY